MTIKTITETSPICLLFLAQTLPSFIAIVTAFEET